jgi:hypothetical protein
VHAQGGGIGEDAGLAVVAGHRELLLVGVRDVHHAGVGGQAGHLAHIRGGERVHQRRLAALERAEDEHIGLLLGDLVDQHLELLGEIRQVPQDLAPRQLPAGAAQDFRRAAEGRKQRSKRLLELFTELTQERSHVHLPRTVIGTLPIVLSWRRDSKGGDGSSCGSAGRPRRSSWPETSTRRRTHGEGSARRFPAPSPGRNLDCSLRARILLPVVDPMLSDRQPDRSSPAHGSGASGSGTVAPVDFTAVVLHPPSAAVGSNTRRSPESRFRS